MRLLSPASNCLGIDVPIGRERSYNGRILEVSDPAHIKALREVGYTVGSVSGEPIRRGGFQCGSCGFKAFFTSCSRCGGTCEREA